MAFKIALYKILPILSLNKLKSTLLKVMVYFATCFAQFPKVLRSHYLGITAVEAAIEYHISRRFSKLFLLVNLFQHLLQNIVLSPLKKCPGILHTNMLSFWQVPKWLESPVRTTIYNWETSISCLKRT